MYVPQVFGWHDSEEIGRFIDACGMAVLVSGDPYNQYVSHLPMLLDREQECLLAHLAVANPQLETLTEARMVQAVFTGENSYVSPRWMVETDAVPTWNYRAVVVHGRCRRLRRREELIETIDRLTRHFEPPGKEAWRIEQLAPDRLDGLLKSIVAIRIDIEQIQAKQKMSQNRSQASRARIVEALESEQRPGSADVARVMRELWKDLS